MQIFIVLSDPQASISTAIFVGRAEFETHINRITVDVCSFSSSTTTSPPPLSPSPSPSVPPTSPDHPVASPSPLLRDVGSTSIAAAPSQARMQVQPPLPFPKGCGRFSFAPRGIRGGRKTSEGDPWSGRPQWWVTKYEPRHLSWFVFAIRLPIPHWRLLPCHQDETPTQRLWGATRRRRGRKWWRGSEMEEGWDNKEEQDEEEDEEKYEQEEGR